MGTDSARKFTPDTSQGDYWDGYMTDFGLYKILAMFPITGLLGLDHLAFRSPFTAFLKLLVNIFFMGAWYVYDIFQIMSDSDSIAKYGMSTPWGPRGHGYKIFGDLNKDVKPSPQNGGTIGTLGFMAYAFCCAFLSFTGFPSLIVGDYFVFILKAITSLFILPIPIYMITGIYEYFTSGETEKVGAKRTYPIISPALMPYLIYNDNQPRYPAINLLPKGEGVKQESVYKESLKAYQADPKNVSYLQWALGLGATAALGGVKSVELVAAASDVTKAAAQTAQATAQGLQKGITQTITEDPKGFVNRFLPPPTAAQTGGGFTPFESDFDWVFISGIAVLVIGGFAAAFFRKMTFPKRKEDDIPRKSYGRDDAPPIPGRV